MPDKVWEKGGRGKKKEIMKKSNDEGWRKEARSECVGEMEMERVGGISEWDVNRERKAYEKKKQWGQRSSKEREKEMKGNQKESEREAE